MKPRNKLFVVGLERCGTHSIVEIVRKACDLPVWHEQEPFLCKEALYRFNGIQTNIEKKICQVRNHEILCEANHRFSFFIEDLAKAFPDSVFLLLLREPVDIIRSRILNLASVPASNHLLPVELAKEMESQYLHDFNRYRITPNFSYDKLYQYYLFDLVETIRWVVKSLSKLPKERFQIHHVARLADVFVPVLHMIDKSFSWNYEEAFKQSLVKSDSVYDKKNKEHHQVVSSLLEPFRQEIESSFLLACTGLCLPANRLSEFLFSPIVMMDRSLGD